MRTSSNGGFRWFCQVLLTSTNLSPKYGYSKHTHTRLFLWIVGLSIDSYCFYTDQTIFLSPNPKPTHYRKPVCIVTLSDKHHLLFFIFFSPRGDSRPVPTMSKISGFSILVGTFGPHNVANTHTPLFLWIVGIFHRRNGFYTVQTAFSITLHQPYT